MVAAVAMVIGSRRREAGRTAPVSVAQVEIRRILFDVGQREARVVPDKSIGDRKSTVMNLFQPLLLG
jgi:hypothetical protein